MKKMFACFSPDRRWAPLELDVELPEDFPDQQYGLCSACPHGGGHINACDHGAWTYTCAHGTYPLPEKFLETGFERDDRGRLVFDRPTFGVRSRAGVVAVPFTRSKP